MTKEEFNTKYKDKFRINDDCDLEQWIECDCEHCQECKYSKKQWIELLLSMVNLKWYVIM
ncbi:hypothetical protein M1770_04870 [Spiroplasma citri]|uniref:hypothetical protein n=1 Tax=Spiroplasma citri TaxID=2133 RepID=UPI002412A3A0|nr:hypothetical protein [Spiroplasma citri]WFG97394.1 hypothetical protein M1770_04870 [Spiroplasma citri]